MSPKPYFLQFSNFKIDTLLATRALFAHKLFRQSDTSKLARFETWLIDVSRIYGVSTPTLLIGNTEQAHGSGVYHPGSQAIVLPKLSVVTLFHEFRHHLQSKGVVQVPRSIGAIEDDARAWSMSLYYQVKPKLFTKAVEENKIFFVTAEQLPQRETSNA